jgi:hypothetical protein
MFYFKPFDNKSFSIDLYKNTCVFILVSLFYLFFLSETPCSKCLSGKFSKAKIEPADSIAVEKE